MNVDGGYWVLGLQMEAIERADRAELPAGDWAIALASDGFLRLADMFAHLGASDLLSIENRAELDRKSTRLELQSLMRISYAVFCLKKKIKHTKAYERTKN